MRTKRTNQTAVAIACAVAVFSAAVGGMWWMSTVPEQRVAAKQSPASKPAPRPPAKPEPTAAEVKTTTESKIRDMLKAAKTAEFLDKADVHRQFGGRWNLKGQFDAQNNFGVFQRHLYSAIVDVEAESGDVELWSLHVDDELWHASPGARKLMDQSGNMFAGTPEQEKQWASSVSRAKSIVQQRLQESGMQFSGHARNGGPQVVEADGRWVVTGQAFSREGKEHRFTVRLSDPGRSPVSILIDGIDYAP